MTFHKTTEEELKKILGGYCWQEDGGSGGYDFNDVKNFISKHFIDKRIIEEEIARHKKLICTINTYCEDPICKKSKYVVEVLHTLLKDVNKLKR